VEKPKTISPWTFSHDYCALSMERSESIDKAASMTCGRLVEAVVKGHISVKGATKVYQTDDGPVESLKPIDLEVVKGEFVVVVGPSGCGKSTLLKMVAGLLQISEGCIEIAGKQVVEPLDDIGIVFQSPVLLAWRSIYRNIMLPVEMRGLDRVAHAKRADALIETAGLSNFKTKLPWQLSGGMQQRAAICRALVHDPSILLMDEPFGALDAMTRERMNVELQRIWFATQKTVLLITHSIPEAVYLADRVVVMSERPGTIAAIYDVEFPRPRPLSVMGSPEFAKLTQTIRAHFFAQGQVDG
jgi:NitT/TauT family transport system ATP-binding protein